MSNGQNEDLDLSFIIDLIEIGKMDNMIEQLIDVVKARRSYLKDLKGANNRATMAPGDHVRITGNISPRYLHGITGVVLPRSPKRAGDLMVHIDDLYYSRIRHRFNQDLGIPADCLEYV